MRVIMVPVSNRPESKTALQVSFDLARKLHADVVGCHLRPHRNENARYKPGGLALFGNADLEWLEQLRVRSTQTVAKQAGELFSQFAEKNDYPLARRPRANAETARWQEKVGSPDKLMAIVGPVADMIVLTRPNNKGHIANLFLTAALLHSSRPVLLLPPRQTRTPGKRIMIAWNQGPEVARFVRAAIPMLQLAEQVTIFVAGKPDRLGPSANDLKTYLSHWDVKSDVVATRGVDVKQELQQEYKDTESDLVLMGAHSRSRFRELVLGSMTTHMLHKSKVPILLQHG